MRVVASTRGAKKPPENSKTPPKGGAIATATKKRAARKKRPARSGGKGCKPPAPGAPDGLKRGTKAYRSWEARRILAMQSTGATKPVIRERLGLTEAEWRHRMNLIRTEVTTAEALLVWACFTERCQRKLAECERVLRTSMEGTGKDVVSAEGQPTGVRRRVAPNLNAAIGALRTQHNIDNSLVGTAIRLGIVRVPKRTPPAADPGRADRQSIS